MLKEEGNIGIIIQLLEEKNNHLEMFLIASDKERKSFKVRNFENVESLYELREDILENICCIDQRIDDYSKNLRQDQISPSEKKKIAGCLKAKEVIVSEIMEKDLEIISCIENEKSTMIKRLSSVRSGRRLVKAYKQMPDIIE